MKVAYIFSTSNVPYILTSMILPQLENGNHGFDVVGMFFFVDNTLMLVKEHEIGERLAKIAAEKSMLLMACDKCVFDRKINDDLIDTIALGCFPDLHEALGRAGLDQVITL